MKQLVARKVVDLSPLLVDRAAPLAVGFSLDGSIYVAAGRAAEPLAEDRGGGTFPKSRLAKGTAYTVVHWNAGERRRVEVKDEVIVASYIQPTPRGFLLVGARCHWRHEGAEANAVEYDWNGVELRRFTAGDGIQDLRTTPNGATWAAFFDEGVFGNYGWSGPGPECIGASGCVRFDAEGSPSFHFSPEDAGTDAICDVYAMNVIGDDDVWLYFYTEFPIVHIADGTYRVWECGIAGARALAVSASRVLLVGDYKQRNLVRLLRLGPDGKSTREAEMPLTDESGIAIDDARAFGVGKTLYLLRGHEVLAVHDW